MVPTGQVARLLLSRASLRRLSALGQFRSPEAASASFARSGGATSPPSHHHLAADRDLRPDLDRHSAADLGGRSQSGWQLRVAPLRARRADVLALTQLFLRRMSAPETLSTDVAEALVLYRWPFNVRELEQVVTASTLRAQGSALRREHLPEALTALLLNRSPRGAVAVVRAAPALEVPSREELCRSLESNDGSVAKVAEHFGKDRRQIYRWAERLGVDPDSFRRE